MRLIAAAALSMVCIPALASADGDAPVKEKTTVFLLAGYSPGASHMGSGALGGLVVHDLTPRLSLEASGSYLGRGMGASAVSASASLLVSLRATSEKAVPYLAAGGGVYRASFDMGDGRFNGPMDMGAGMEGCNCGAMGTGTMPQSWDYGQMPHFYGYRMGERPGQGQPYGERSFTDPAFSLGGGIRIDLGSRLTLRPDLRALFVAGDGETDAVGLFTINFGYRF